MKLLKPLSFASVAIALVLAFTALVPSSVTAAPSGDTIADIAKSNPDFSILVGALEATGLDQALDGRRHFTVFAPTNDAFLALIEEVGEETFNAIVNDPEALSNVLLYHVSPGERFAEDVVSSERIRMLNKGFTFPSVDGGVFLVDANGRSAEIIATDIEASNGVIHVIDKVVLP